MTLRRAVRGVTFEPDLLSHCFNDTQWSVSADIRFWSLSWLNGANYSKPNFRSRSRSGAWQGGMDSSALGREEERR
jgi:hypothetical protein